MQVQLNSGNLIAGSTDLSRRVSQSVEHRLKHLAGSVTRVEVYVDDENAAKSGAVDKRCLMEARVKGMQPVSVEHRAETLDLAIGGAAVQLARALKNALDKADAGEKGGATIRRNTPEQRAG